MLDWQALLGPHHVAENFVRATLTFDYLGAYVPALRGMLRSEPVEVIRDGEVITRNLRREFITEEEARQRGRLRPGRLFAPRLNLRA